MTEVSTTLIHLFILKLDKYENGLVKIIKELCGFYTNQKITKWVSIIDKFIIKKKI
mgnify:FL=1